MDESALFKIQYGLFVVGVELNNKLSGCVINTATQVTAIPNRMAVTILKSNFTTEQIRAKGSMTISILSKSSDINTIEKFGFKTSRECNKFEDEKYKLDINNNPYLLDNITAVISLKISEEIDLDTHYEFICDVVDCENLSDEEAITYSDYRKIKSGKKINKEESQSKESTTTAKKYVCSVCHYVYDGDIPFEDLPDDYVCPICKKGKEAFVLL
ncbi:MAG: flavin reductase [Clostridiales bacterium]|nr:flavin reductase [Clostridiales bacterium]